MTLYQVPAAVEALGGAAESLDPLTLLMASGGDGGSSWKRSEMDGIAIRLQVSNGIPIQVSYNSSSSSGVHRAWALPLPSLVLRTYIRTRRNAAAERPIVSTRQAPRATHALLPPELTASPERPSSGSTGE